MRNCRVLLVLFLALVVALSFLGTIKWMNNVPEAGKQQTKIPIVSFGRTQYDLLTFPCFTFPLSALTLTSTEVAMVADNNIVDLSNANRTRIYDFVVSNPGVQFRGICTALCLAIGTAEFHLGVLKKAGLISFFRDGRYKRFFASKKYTAEQMQIISLLRHDTVAEIFRYLLSRTKSTHGQLAVHLSISSQGLTWQMNRLVSTGVVKEHRLDRGVFYWIDRDESQFISDALVTLLAQ